MLKENESGMKGMSFESWFYFQIRNMDRGFSAVRAVKKWVTDIPAHCEQNA
jgi:hypothetical protein